MSGEPAGVIPFVIEQHVEDAAFLNEVRGRLTRAAHVKLKELATFDKRLAAQLDAIAIAGSEGRPFCQAALESPSAGAVFTATVTAIEGQQNEWLVRLIALAETSESIQRGLTSAFGWVSQSSLKGSVASLLRDPQPFRQIVGLTACALHRVDCGLATGPWLDHSDPGIRARALRMVGEIGLNTVLSRMSVAMHDENTECRFWSAWSTVLLGGSEYAADILRRTAVTAEPHADRAFTLALQSMRRDEAHAYVRDVPREVMNSRRLIHAAGVIGDPEYVPWLISLMPSSPTARVAAESFSLITGVDIRSASLHANRPEDFEGTPNDNPDDGNIDIDSDEGLPWPATDKVQAWWRANEDRFDNGMRYFMGAPVTREHCIQVLKTGYQRQRILAAQYLCLLESGTPLFNTSAPAWRQQRWLAKM